MAIPEETMSMHERSRTTGYTYTDQHGTASSMEICDALNVFGAEARPVYKAFSMQPAFQKHELVTADGIWRGDDEDDCNNGQSGATADHQSLWSSEPISHELFKTALCLPSDVSMTEKEQDTIIEIILSCFDKQDLDREAWEVALGRIS